MAPWSICRCAGLEKCLIIVNSLFPPSPVSHVLGVPTPEDQLNSTWNLTPAGRNLWQDQGVIVGGGGVSWVKEEEEEERRTDTEHACCRWHKLALNRGLYS